jgi:hypothetical protein
MCSACSKVIAASWRLGCAEPIESITLTTVLGNRTQCNPFAGTHSEPMREWPHPAIARRSNVKPNVCGAAKRPAG